MSEVADVRLGVAVHASDCKCASVDPLTLVHEDETLDDLQVSGCRLIQKKKGFRFGMDSVLLAHFTSVSARASVSDLGAGAGVLTLLLAAHGKGKHFYAVEVQKETAEMMRRTVRLNGLEDRITVYNCDVSRASEMIGGFSVDAVVCNPPYSEPGASVISGSESRGIAKHQKRKTLDAFFSSAYSILKGKGRMFLVYPAPQMLKVMNRLSASRLEPKRVRLVHPFSGRPARLVLIEAIKDAKPMLEVLPPLIVYSSPGVMTEELREIYGTD